MFGCLSYFLALLQFCSREESNRPINLCFFSRSSEERSNLFWFPVSLLHSGSLVLSLHSGLTLLLSLISFERKEKIGRFVNIACVQLEQVIVC